MEKLIPFDYHGNQVRTVSIDGEPWFVAKDVIAILDIGNVTDALSRLDDDEKGFDSIDTLGGIQEMSIITESGLYSLTLGSKKPEAKPFKRWVTHEVIPAIRKTGTYSAKPMSQVEMLAAQAQAMVELERKANEAKQIATDTKAAITTALDVFTKPTGDDWQQCMNDRVRKICVENRLPYLQFWGDLYREIDRTARVNLKSQQSRKKTRLKAQGAKTTEIKAVSVLSIIDNDPKLRLILDSLVRRYEAKYAAQQFPNGAA